MTMTVTFRKALHKSILGCLKYIVNPQKTDSGLLVSGINCSPDASLAYNEMLMINRLYNNKGGRTGYHIYQSFNYTDKLTYEEAHEIGIETAKQLYPDYQVVIATHIDKAHIHNHIVLNSVNMKTGKKLTDSLWHEEGISNLRKVSDEISREHGLTVIDNAPPINKYSKKNFIYNFANKSWRVKIKEDIERLIENADDFEELLELLENEGYLISKGRYTGVKTFGMNRFIRLKSIDDGKYSEQSLRQRISAIHYQKFQEKLIKSGYISYKKINVADNHMNDAECNKLRDYISLQQYKMKTLINKQDQLTADLMTGNNSEYYKRRYLIVKEINQINKVFEIMNNENIHSYEEIDQQIFNYENKYSDLKKEYDDLKIYNRQLQKLLPVLKIYNETFYFNDLIKQCAPAEKTEMIKIYNKELRLFDEAEKELNRFMQVSSIADAKKLMTEANKLKADANNCLIEIKNISKKIESLNYIKSFKYRSEIDKLNRILTKGFYANKEQILDSDREGKKLVMLHNQRTCLEVDQEAVSWVKYNKKAYIYIIEDEQYKIYDKENKRYCDEISGINVDDFMKHQKSIDYNYY
ncbi:MAG: relaxase/mobilization nuclease domain-containing protein [Thomasclavelia ramosa]